MNTLTVANTEIKMTDGLYCLNDLHTASGGAAKNAPSQWLANKSTKEFILTMEISIVKLEGRYGGTFTEKKAVYAYAMWISPTFQGKVIDAYDAMVTGAKPEPEPEPEPTSRIEILAQMVLSMAEQEKETRAHAKQLEEIRDDVDFLNSVPTIPRVIRPSKFVGNGFVVSLEGVKLRPAMFNLVEQFVERYNRTRDGKHEINVNSIVHAALEQFLHNNH